MSVREELGSCGWWLGSERCDELSGQWRLRDARAAKVAVPEPGILAFRTLNTLSNAQLALIGDDGRRLHCSLDPYSPSRKERWEPTTRVGVGGDGRRVRQAWGSYSPFGPAHSASIMSTVRATEFQ